MGYFLQTLTGPRSGAMAKLRSWKKVIVNMAPNSDTAGMSELTSWLSPPMTSISNTDSARKISQPMESRARNETALLSDFKLFTLFF